MANSNGWGDGAANNAIGWGQGANNNIGWGKSHSLSNAGLTDIVGLTTDADAQAFITAAAITDATQQSAINNLVVAMKADGVWTKMKAIYPFVGGTASTHKWNLKDPRDLDAAFRLVFNGGWTHSSTGATPNGTNGFADTKLNDNTILNLSNVHASIYSRTNVNGAFVDLGVSGGTNSGINLFTRLANLTYFRIHDEDAQTISTLDSRGLFLGYRNSASTKNYSVNGVKTTLTSTVGSKANGNIYLGALLTVPAAIVTNYSSRQIAFSSIGDGLTDTEAQNLYTRVQAFQTALSRNV
jgi:hypothetical protein